MKLTAKSIEKLKPDKARRREIPDGLCPGLYFVIQPSGSRSWAVRYRHSGKTRKYTIGRYSEFSLKEARDEARDALKLVTKDIDPAKLRKQKKLALSNQANILTNAVEEYLQLELRPNRSVRHVKETKRIFKTSVFPNLGNHRIQEITKGDILGLVNGIAGRGTPIIANRVLAAVRRFFNWCVEQDILDQSPCAGIKAPARELSRDRVLNDDEVRWFWRACEITGYPFGHCAKVLLLTGQRLSEVAQMSRREIMGDTWTIPAARSKNSKPHSVPLSQAVKNVLDECPIIKNPQFYVFTTNAETAISGFSKSKARFDRIMLKEARHGSSEPSEVKLPPWRLHDLRRTVASGMARLGIALPVIEKVLNHTGRSFSGVAGVYQRHQFDEEKRKALALWGNHIQTIVSEMK